MYNNYQKRIVIEYYSTLKYVAIKSGTYFELIVVENLVTVAAEEVSHIIVREGGVNRTSHISPAIQRPRVVAIHAVPSNAIVLITCARQTRLSCTAK